MKTLFNQKLGWKQRKKGPNSFIALGIVAYRSQCSNVNYYCTPSNLGHQFNLILLISTRNIKREIEILHQKPEIGKISN